MSEAEKGSIILNAGLSLSSLCCVAKFMCKYLNIWSPLKQYFPTVISVMYTGNISSLSCTPVPFIFCCCVLIKPMMLCIENYSIINWTCYKLGCLFSNHPPSLVLWHCWLGHRTCKNVVSEMTTVCQVGPYFSRRLFSVIWFVGNAQVMKNIGNRQYLHFVEYLVLS